MSVIRRVPACLGVLVLALVACSAAPQQTRPMGTVASPKRGGAVQKAPAAVQVQSKPGDNSALIVSGNEVVSLLVTDPSGRRLGDDARSKQAFNEIPGGSVESNLTGSDEDEADDAGENITIPQPDAGSYSLAASGRKTGAYEFTVSGSELSGGHSISFKIRGMIASAGEEDRFTITLPPARDTLRLAGAFRLNPNSPFSYSREVRPQTLISSRAPFLPLLVFHDETIDPASVAVTANGRVLPADAGSTGQRYRLLRIPLRGQQIQVRMSAREVSSGASKEDSFVLSGQ